jgi:hypothetical protein
MSDDLEIDAEAFLRAQAKIEAGKFKQKAPATGKASRKTRERSLADSVDGRALRPAGRSAQWNIRCRPGLREEAIEAARIEGVSLATWIERVVEAAVAAALKKDGSGNA